ncbi:MAG: DUF3618 domain-containing protein [Candidatus Eremiobacteraeota bacterium]|nr:DUF3618 domain-containing protein [Candidatus Eremiobacteraeota bacterium]MBV8263809.1 DUF3618 domain-containing protein [Candidatus Eremiobacteraeota bacterium]MBV8459384.1 DUF3618 domain-containing protein [Candidatus Eremiobacteraeota bacterium]MBV8596088.1 DUF3618 domain-containing protein [Candidatus Eremiobacteraeota bacterium]MBV8669883.1 DUF3618 domain-containing protein [Candidatus Eremiobacteraeota bacterium]
MGKDADQIRREIAYTREEMGDTVEAIGYRADIPRRIKDSISDTVDTVKDRFAETTTGVRSGVASGLAKIDEQLPDADDLREGARQAVQTMRDNPVGLGLGALALGFLAGMLVPSTDFERDRLGSVSQRVKNETVEMGQEMFERGKRVATQATESVRDSAQKESQEMMSSMKDRARDVTRDITRNGGDDTTS